MFVIWNVKLVIINLKNWYFIVQRAEIWKLQAHIFTPSFTNHIN